jgi:hypothetical protein
MADVETAAPQRCYEIVSDPERLWILPEPWKTPGCPEIDRSAILAFPTTPWTGYARPQAPQPRLLLISLKAKVMYDSLDWTRREQGDR